MGMTIRMMMMIAMAIMQVVDDYNLDGSTADGDAVRRNSSSEIFDIHLTCKSKT